MYENELNKREMNKLRSQYNTLEQSFLNLQSKYSKIKTQYNSIISKESYFKALEFKYNEKEEQILKLNQELDSNDTKQRKYVLDTELKYEKNVNQLKYQFENNLAKVDNAAQMEKYVPFLLDQIQTLQAVIRNYESEERKRVKEREILFEKEYSTMKKKMLEYIKAGKKKGRNLTVSQADLNNKLDMLNHNQLLSELNIQSIQIETLLKDRENLDQIIREVKSDLNFHLEYEKVLTEKNKKFAELLKNFSPQIDKAKVKATESPNKIRKKETPLSQSFSSNQIASLTLNRTMKAPFFNQNLSGFSTQRDSSIPTDRTKISLHKELIQKQKEIESLKGKYDTLKDTLNSIESKFKNIIVLCEEALAKISNANFLKSKEIFINMEELKSCDFSSMTPEQKYSSLTMLINHFLPLVNQEVIKRELSKQSLEKVERRFYLKKTNQIKTFNPLINTSISFSSNRQHRFKAPRDVLKILSHNNKEQLIKPYSILKSIE